MKKYVVLGLAARNYESVIALGTFVAEKLTNNPLFTNPPFTGEALSDAVKKFSKSNAASKLSRGRQDYAIARAHRDVVEGMLNQLETYVNLVANGNQNIILSAGMSYNKTRERWPAPDQVKNINTVFTGIPGSIQVKWQRVKNSKWYHVYISTTPDNASSWKLLSTLDTRKLMVQNLESGTHFYFKVVPVNASGVGPDSDIASTIAA